MSEEEPVGLDMAEEENNVPIDGAAGEEEVHDLAMNTIDDGSMEPDVIGTYTHAEDGGESVGLKDGDAVATAGGSRPASGTSAADAGSRPHNLAFASPPSRTDSMQNKGQEDAESGLRPASALSNAGSRPASAVVQQGSVEDSPMPASAAMPAAAGSRPTSAALPAEQPASSSRPASAAMAEQLAAGSRPASAAPAEPSTHGSRPASGAAAKQTAPGSRPASAVNVQPSDGSRPASAAQAGSRPASAAMQAGSRPVSADVQAASQPEASPGSRPASTQVVQGSTENRPGSSGSAQPAGSRPASAAPPAAGSRPASAVPLPLPSVTASRPGSGQAAASTLSADLRPLSAQVAGNASRPASQHSNPPTAPAFVPGPAGVSKASGGSRPASSASTMATPGVWEAEARPSSAALKAQAAEQAGYAVPGMRAIDVQVDQGSGLPHRMLRVFMDHTQTESKAYIGGFRNKRTGAVYHHAVTQTPKAPKFAGAEPKLERQTQTVKISTRTQQTVREAATQMERPGVILDTTYDVVRTPGKYQTSEERLAIVTGATRTIQRWVRGWIGRKRAAYLRSKKREREAFLQEQEMKAQQAAEEHRRREIERRMHPRTAADFEILYNELEAWRLQETRKIKEAGLAPDKEQEVLQQLLHKETKLLQTIDRLKINANHENKDIRIQHTLGDMSKPKQYELKNGKKVEVHTPFTTRAKELMQLYNGLNLPMLTIDERLDVLLHVKWTVKEFDCNLTREIVSLIDREADLLNRGRSPAMLEGLRKRISSLFLNFVETPEFNPQSARFQVVPMDFENYLFQKLEKSSSGQTVTVKHTSKWDT